MTDNNVITLWLNDSKLPVTLVGGNRWQIKMSHRYCDYVVTITKHGNWFSYGADLIGDIRGQNRAEFYQRILELNSRLNGVHIAMENNRIALIRDDFTEDISKYSLYRSLNLFHESHEYVYKMLLDEAQTQGVRLIAP